MTPPLDPLRIVDAQFAAGAAQLDQLPAPTGVEIAFAGRSNVGKSSLLNALCARKNLVRTSSTPGCTRQISFFSVRTKDGASATLVDLPGYGYAKRSKGERNEWAHLIESYLLERPTLGVVVALVDVRRGPEEDDAQLFELLRGPARIRRPALRVLTVGTKLDKLAASQRKVAAKQLSDAASGEAIAVSVELPDTVTHLWHRLRQLADLGAATT